MRVLGYGSGQASEALDIIEDCDADIDLVFADVLMPGLMNGVGLAKWVHEHRPGMLVLLTSGVARFAENISEFYGRGEFIAKPYACDVVASRIRALTDARKDIAPVH